MCCSAGFYGRGVRSVAAVSLQADFCANGSVPGNNFVPWSAARSTASEESTGLVRFFGVSVPRILRGCSHRDRCHYQDSGVIRQQKKSSVAAQILNTTRGYIFVRCHGQFAKRKSIPFTIHHCSGPNCSWAVRYSPAARFSYVYRHEGPSFPTFRIKPQIIGWPCYGLYRLLLTRICVQMKVTMRYSMARTNLVKNKTAPQN